MANFDDYNYVFKDGSPNKKQIIGGLLIMLIVSKFM